jgi:hypothetical protein
VVARRLVSSLGKGLGIAALLAACDSPVATTAPVGGQPTLLAPQAGVPSAQATAPVGQSIEACSLLSDDEIQDLTDRSIASMIAQPVMGIYENGCHWELDPGSDDIVGWSIDVGVRSPGGRSYFDTFLAPYSVGPVSGLGDAAVTMDGGSIEAVKGDTLVSTFVIAFSADDEEALTRQLAETALSRVP